MDTRLLLWLAGSLAACQPSPGHPQGLGDGGRGRPVDANVAHSAPVADASRPVFDAAQHAAETDASEPYVSSSDASTIEDAAVDGEVPTDFCGNALPASPSKSGLLDSSAVWLPAIAQRPGVSVRGPGFSAALGARVLWVFGATYAQNDAASVLASSSATFSGIDRPFALDEASDSTPPTTLIPELADDRAQAGPDAQLSYELGNPLVLPLSDTVLFYTVSARLGDNSIKPLGTRMARLTAGKTITAQPEPALLFSGAQPPFLASTSSSEGRAYIYGCTPSEGAGYDCKLVRVSLGSMDEPTAYQYRALGGWSNDVTAATVVISNVSATLSVSYNAYLNGYLLASFVPLSNRITVQSAARPEGPWTELGQLTVPALPNAANGSLPSYAVEHAELSSNCGKSLLLTYLSPAADNQLELRPVQVELR